MPSGSILLRSLRRWSLGKPAWLDTLDPQDLLVFVHIPKAAGTSLNDLFEGIYGRTFLNVSNHRRAWEGRRPDPGGIRCLAGHFRYGWHRRLGAGERVSPQSDGIFEGRRIRYVTVVRDPVERFQSFYRYVQSRPKHRLHAAAAGLSPREFVDLLDASGVREGWDLQHRQVGCALGERFFLAAPLPRLGEFVEVLGQAMGWPARPEVPHSNRSRKEAFPGFDEALLDLVRERNPRDAELYAEVERRFEAADFPAFRVAAAREGAGPEG
jgi:hypothetical protein